jgi:serine/threonine-protein kinase HipA
MTDTLVVLLGDEVAGLVSRLAGGRLRFDYDEQYQARGSATPVSLSMPVQVRSHPDHIIRPWLWNLLPDNDAVLSRWARQFQASATSPFSLLSTPVGQDCAGAVRFVPPGIVDDVLAQAGRVRWLTQEQVAENLRELRADSTAWLGGTFTGRFSLAGAQPKTALLRWDGRWGVPSGPLATTHILKPAVATLDDHDLNEHLCLDAAYRAGLVVARTTVGRFADETAIVIDRYDRRVAGRHVARIHQEDLCQSIGVPPARKYQADGGPGAGDVAGLFSRTMPSRAAADALTRFRDALIWNWLIAGTDAHAKNYSVLLSGGQARLAPLYDVASALPYGVHERKLRFAMRIGGTYEVYPFRNPWPVTAAELGMDAAATIDRALVLAERAPEVFSDAARAAAVVSLRRDLPVRLTDLVAERAKRCAAMLSRPGRR